MLNFSIKEFYLYFYIIVVLVKRITILKHYKGLIFNHF